MVEIHLVWLKPTVAVGTWHTTERPQELQILVLSSSHPGDLSRAISRVVRDVRGPLIPNTSHPPHYRTFVQQTRSAATDTPRRRRGEPAASARSRRGAAERRPEALLEDDEDVQVGATTTLVVLYAHGVGAAGGPRLARGEPSQ